MVKGSITPLANITHNIKVNVTNGTDPIGNVSVTLTDSDNNEYSGKTGDAGGCNIKNVPEGQYNVVATASGYNEYTGTINVNEETTTLNITLTEE